MREKLAKYEQIRQDIIHKIESMEYRPNQVIPSENELCASYGVSRITVRKAIDELVHEGLLYRIKGKGSFVRDHGSEGLSRIYSFTEAILHQGKTPSKKLLSLKVEEADADIRRRMGLEEGEEVYVIKSIYYADGRPYCINTSILPRKLFPKLELFDFNRNSLYEVLKSFYQLSFTKARQILTATVGSSEIYGYLETEQNQPLLRINAASFCLYHDNETVFEIYESYILTDILSYYVEKYNT